MRYTAADLITAIAIPVTAALGGGFAVFSGYDDAPGGVFIGGLLVIAAVALGLRAARRRG